jgi:hypothetical protein
MKVHLALWSPTAAALALCGPALGDVRWEYHSADPATGEVAVMALEVHDAAFRFGLICRDGVSPDGYVVFHGDAGANGVLYVVDSDDEVVYATDGTQTYMPGLADASVLPGGAGITVPDFDLSEVADAPGVPPEAAAALAEALNNLAALSAASRGTADLTPEQMAALGNATRGSGGARPQAAVTGGLGGGVANAPPVIGGDSGAGDGTGPTDDVVESAWTCERTSTSLDIEVETGPSLEEVTRLARRISEPNSWFLCRSPDEAFDRAEMMVTAWGSDMSRLPGGEDVFGVMGKFSKLLNEPGFPNGLRSSMLMFDVDGMDGAVPVGFVLNPSAGSGDAGGGEVGTGGAGDPGGAAKQDEDDGLQISSSSPWLLEQVAEYERIWILTSVYLSPEGFDHSVTDWAMHRQIPGFVSPGQDE